MSDGSWDKGKGIYCLLFAVTMDASGVLTELRDSAIHELLLW